MKQPTTTTVALTLLALLFLATLAFNLSRSASAEPSVTYPPLEKCPWDLDGSGNVGVNDMPDLIAQWGTNPGGPPDFDGDGVVAINDFLTLLANWGPCLTTLQVQLQTIRSAIELYNDENPHNPYDAATIPYGGFWDPLLENSYLQKLPANPLQNYSTMVASAPAVGVGWVWAEAFAGDPWTLDLYAVDENGGWYDGNRDGSPD